MRRTRVIALMGPTASGKSDLALALARRLGCEIVSVDSAMVYRGMDIGTAKPSAAERSAVRHHLIDILDPTEPFSTGRFCDLTLTLVPEIVGRANVVLLVGGTMLYFNALLHGLSSLPPANQAVRREIDEEAARAGWPAMHRRLASIDADAAARIHPNDPQRIQRALEVFRVSGRTMTELQRRSRRRSLPFDTIRLIVAPADRDALHRRIERRFFEMLEQGLIGEVQRLVARGDLQPEMPSIRCVGYRQVWEYLHGRYDLRTMRERAIVATRQLAKRQLTWLRRERSAVRYATEESDLETKVLNDVRRAL